MKARRSAGTGQAWVVRAERPDDAAAIAVVHRGAFEGSPHEAQLVEAIRASAGYIPALSLVAEAGAWWWVTRCSAA